jgi:hypothetical protein
MESVGVGVGEAAELPDDSALTVTLPLVLGDLLGLGLAVSVAEAEEHCVERALREEVGGAVTVGVSEGEMLGDAVPDGEREPTTVGVPLGVPTPVGLTEAVPVPQALLLPVLDWLGLEDAVEDGVVRALPLEEDVTVLLSECCEVRVDATVPEEDWLALPQMVCKGVGE